MSEPEEDPIHIRIHEVFGLDYPYRFSTPVVGLTDEEEAAAAAKEEAEG